MNTTLTSTPPPTSNPTPNPARTIALLLTGLFLSPAFWLYSALIITRTTNNSPPTHNLRIIRALTILSQLLALATAIELVKAWSAAFTVLQNLATTLASDPFIITVTEAASTSKTTILPVVLIGLLPLHAVTRSTWPAQRVFPHSAFAVPVLWGVGCVATCVAYLIVEDGEKAEGLVDSGMVKGACGVTTAIGVVGGMVWLECCVRACLWRFVWWQPRRDEDNGMEQGLLARMGA